MEYGYLIKAIKDSENGYFRGIGTKVKIHGTDEKNPNQYYVDIGGGAFYYVDSSFIVSEKVWKDIHNAVVQEVALFVSKDGVLH